VRKIAVLTGWTVLIAVLSVTGFASEEGTRHITGKNIDVYFMNDKVFGHVKNNPLWAIYNCGSDIKGQIDVKGTYHKFDLRYHRGGDQKITGSFGPENSIIEGETDSGEKIKMLIDGHLCPFATAGLILIIAGSMILS
jgi:hypothetical protein